MADDTIGGRIFGLLAMVGIPGNSPKTRGQKIAGASMAGRGLWFYCLRGVEKRPSLVVDHTFHMQRARPKLGLLHVASV